MTDNSRVEELRRRVQADPTSIAFAALAEEYRRAGQYEEAIDVCRAGLNRHPQYLSARVTLGRALIELNELDEAKMELDQVLSIAPENLAAIRALAEIQERRGAVAPPAAPATPPQPTIAPPANTPFELDLMPVATSRTPISLKSDVQAPPPELGALTRFLDAILERKSHSA